MFVGQCHDGDDEDQDLEPEFVFNPVESDEKFDDVVNALERDLELLSCTLQSMVGRSQLVANREGQDQVSGRSRSNSRPCVRMR